MARGKVAECIRKRAMQRKSAEAGPKSWSSSSGAPSGSGNDTFECAGGGASPAHSKSWASAFLSALLRWRRLVNVLAVLWEQVVYHMMWLVESVVLVGRLCFFLMRFGFKQL
ncbi:hypothetical protein CFC21_091109 [Triticum aestivum]|uniref:Uncharacterized protein n=2 Tax=Triticum aestivum TaxID=4565 RepID=A0A3B6Q9S8_WHEAT|nr:hypothetical protein CFC21_091109 [Triticum aestivum]